MTAIHISLAVVSDIDQLCELLDSLFTQEVEFSNEDITLKS